MSNIVMEIPSKHKPTNKTTTKERKKMNNETNKTNNGTDKINIATLSRQLHDHCAKTNNLVQESEHEAPSQLETRWGAVDLSEREYYELLDLYKEKGGLLSLIKAIAHMESLDASREIAHELDKLILQAEKIDKASDKYWVSNKKKNCPKE